MIKLTKLNGKTFILNADLIETVESTPDTVVTLTTDKKYIVTEKTDDIINKVIQYKRRIFCSETLNLEGKCD
ncbi:MAG: flagellar FlbD family protein [Thermoanaerobacteraceae bacterium]|nr:flagellar FlbD family protein [Thermoanaerobacteraceae bacterium]